MILKTIVFTVWIISGILLILVSALILYNDKNNKW